MGSIFNEIEERQKRCAKKVVTTKVLQHSPEYKKFVKEANKSIAEGRERYRKAAQNASKY